MSQLFNETASNLLNIPFI